MNLNIQLNKYIYIHIYIYRVVRVNSNIPNKGDCIIVQYKMITYLVFIVVYICSKLLFIIIQVILLNTSK